MKADLTTIEEALAGLTDIELHALAVAAIEAPPIAPALLAWIKGACDWEANRRRGFDYRLQRPGVATDRSEDAVNIEATRALRAAFATGDLAPATLKFLDALAELPTGGERKR